MWLDIILFASYLIWRAQWTFYCLIVIKIDLSKVFCVATIFIILITVKYVGVLTDEIIILNGRHFDFLNFMNWQIEINMKYLIINWIYFNR